MATFGRTGNGGSTSTSSADSNLVNRATEASSTCPADGVLGSVKARVWLSATGSTHGKGVIYDSSGNLLATGDEITINNTTEAELTFPFSGANAISLVGGTSYAYGIMFDDPGSMNFTWSRQDNSSTTLKNGITYPTPQNPIGSGTVSGPVDMYIDYVVEEAPSITYLQTASSAADGATYTFSSQNLGTIADNRYIAVAIGSRKSGASTTLNSVTVGGVTATIIDSQITHATNVGAAAIAVAAVPAGTTGDVVVTWADSMVRCTISLYRLTGINPTVIDSVTSGADDPTGSLDVVNGGMAIGVVSTSINSTCTWTGLIEDYDNNETGESTYRHTVASLEPSSTSTITVTASFASSIESAGVFASWASESADIPTNTGAFFALF